MADEAVQEQEQKTEISPGFWSSVSSWVIDRGRHLNKGVENAAGGITALVVGGIPDLIDNSPRLLGKPSISMQLTGEEWKPIEGIRDWYSSRQKESETYYYGKPLEREDKLDTVMETAGEMMLPFGGTVKASKGISLAEAWAKSREDIILKGYNYQSLRIKAATVLDTAGAYIKSHIPGLAGTATENSFRATSMAFKRPIVVGSGAAAAIAVDNWATGSEITNNIVRYGSRLGGLGLNLGATVLEYSEPTLFTAAKETIRPAAEFGQVAMHHVVEGGKSALNTFSDETGIDPGTAQDLGTQVVRTLSSAPVKVVVTAAEMAQNQKDATEALRDRGEKVTPETVTWEIVTRRMEEKRNHAEQVKELATQQINQHPGLQERLEDAETAFADLQGQGATPAESDPETAPIASLTTHQNAAAAGMDKLKRGMGIAKEEAQKTAEQLAIQTGNTTQDGTHLLAGTQASLSERAKKLREKAKDEEQRLAALTREEAEKLKTQGSAALDKGKQYVDTKKGQIVEAGITSGLSSIFNPMGKWMEENLGINAATGLKIAAFALGGTTLGSMMDNKMGGLVLGLMFGIMYAAFEKEIKAGASSMASSLLPDNPANRPPQPGFTPAPAAP